MEELPLIYPQHNPEVQLRLLGISKKELVKLRQQKSRVLDIGCGEEARLVQYLRERNIEAEGIDPFLRISSPYLIRLRVSQTNPPGKGIPQPDKRYHLIVSHANFVLPMGLSDCRKLGAKMLSKKGEHPTNIRKRLDEVSFDSQWIILEAMRTLKKGGRFVSYPGLNNLEKIMGEDFWETPIRITHEKVPSIFRGEYDFMENRTVIYKL